MRIEAQDEESINSTNITTLPSLVGGMVMMTTSHYHGKLYPPCRSRPGPRSSAGTDAMAAHSKNSVGAQRISGPTGGTSNNNSMSKAIKTTPTAATAKAKAGTTRIQSQPQSGTTRNKTLARTKTSTSLERSNNGSCRPTTWDEMLSARTKASSHPSDVSPGSACNKSALHQFDPHRTLAFLITELHSKLKTSIPADKAVHRIMDEVGCALKRIGDASQPSRLADVTSDSNLMQRNRVKYGNSSAQTEKHSIRCCEKSVQTGRYRPCSLRSPSKWQDCVLTSTRREKPSPRSNPSMLSTPKKATNNYQMPRESPTAEKTLESSKDKYKERSKVTQVDSDWKEFRKARISIADKDAVGEKLENYKKEKKELRIQVAYLEERLQTADARESFLIQELENRCKLLQVELKTLQDIVRKQTNELSVVQELSAKLKESAMKINLLEMSKLEADKILVFTQLEKEKLAMLQKFQEKQVSTLQSEVNNLTKVVREQLEDIHNNTRSSISKAFAEEPSKFSAMDKYLSKSPLFAMDDTISSIDVNLKEDKKKASCRRYSLDEYDPKSSKKSKTKRNHTSCLYACPQTIAEANFVESILKAPSNKVPYCKHSGEKQAVKKDDNIVAARQEDQKKDNSLMSKSIRYEPESMYYIGKNNKMSKTMPDADSNKKKKDSSSHKSARARFGLKTSPTKDKISPVLKDSVKLSFVGRRKKGGDNTKKKGQFSSSQNDIHNKKCDIYKLCRRPLSSDSDESPEDQKKMPTFSLDFDEKISTFHGRKPIPTPETPVYKPPSYTSPSLPHRTYKGNCERYILEEQNLCKDNSSHATSETESS